MQPKLKQCSMCPEGVLRPIWKNMTDENGERFHLCKSHAMVKVAKKQIEEGKASKQTYDDFCRSLWKKRKHVSQLSGKTLPEYDPHSSKFCNLIRFHMHHFWAKSKHPELMLDENNIIFLTREEHAIVEFGSENQKESIGWNTFVKIFNQ